RLRPVAHGPQRERGRRAGTERGERGVAGERRDREPDQAEGDRRRPRQPQQQTDIGGDALAALETEPNREEVAEKGAGCGRQCELVGEIAIFAAVVGIDEQHGERALERIADKRRRGEPLVAGAQHVGRAGIAGADGADVGGAGEARQDQPERDRAAEIAEGQRRGVGRQQRRIEPWRHGHSLLPLVAPAKAVPRVPTKVATQSLRTGFPLARERAEFCCAVAHLNGDTARMRILLTRVTSKFRYSPNLRLLVIGARTGAGARTPNLASATPGATSAPVIFLLWSCYFGAVCSISYSFSERYADGLCIFPVIYRAPRERSALPLPRPRR